MRYCHPFGIYRRFSQSYSIPDFVQLIPVYSRLFLLHIRFISVLNNFHCLIFLYDCIVSSVCCPGFLKYNTFSDSVASGFARTQLQVSGCYSMFGSVFFSYSFSCVSAFVSYRLSVSLSFLLYRFSGFFSCFLFISSIIRTFVCVFFSHLHPPPPHF